MTEIFSTYWPVLAAIAVSVLFTAIYYRNQLQQATNLLEQQQEQQLGYLEQQLADSKEVEADTLAQLAKLREQQLQQQQIVGQMQQQVGQINNLRQEKAELTSTIQQLQDKLSTLNGRYEALQATHNQQQQTAQEKIELLESAEQRLQQQFENLANRIFEKKSETFTQTSKTSLDALLTPLKEKIDGFKQQVTSQYVEEGKERASLKTEILSLKALNQQITEDAAALTKALKGDNKQQGNWGEVILERILKESGLREGHEFETQVALKNQQGKQYQPDVVVHLPNDKDVVIDSKVSLSAYERYFNQQDDEVARQQHLQDHVNSLKNHIRELGKKDYHELKGLRSLDYVLMFIPVEPAFLLALEHSPNLVQLALDNNIMLVSPTNLLVALRTINNIWQYEYQNQNAQHIAEHAGKLYDKFHGFVADLEKVGKSLDSTQKHYQGAWSKLSEGRGNLLRQTEKFREMGVQTNKRLDPALTQKNSNGEDSEKGE